MLDLERARKWLERYTESDKTDNQLWLLRQTIRVLMDEIEANNHEIDARLTALEKEAK